MADNFNTRVAEALLRHDIDLSKLDAGNRKRIQSLFRSLGKDVADHVLSIDPTASAKVTVRNRKLRQLVSVASETIEEGFEEIEKIIDADAKDLARVEARTVAQAVNSTIGVELMSGRLSPNLLKRLADQTLINGAPSRDWLRDQKEFSLKAFTREMREGVLQNEPISELVRRIRGRREHGFKDGLINYDTKASRRAAALARSSVMATANAARFETYVQNRDVIKGVEWKSTLDKRTTEICIALDGQAWTLEGKRLPGTTAPWRGPPPAHWNCRSTLTPVLKAWSDLITDPEAKKKVLARERSGKLPKGWRASMDGQVSADLDYGQWLRKKERAEPGFAKEILGAGKYKLWKEGKLKTRDLIDQSHADFTLKDLTDKLAGKRRRRRRTPPTGGGPGPGPAPAPPAAAAPLPSTLDEYIKSGGERVQGILNALPLKAKLGSLEERGRAFREALDKELRKVRGFDREIAVANKGKAVSKVKIASTFYPDDWIERAEKAGKLFASYSRSRPWAWTNRRTRRIKMGRYATEPGDGVIQTDDSLASAIHEFAHRLQETVIGLDELFQQLHRRRTKGEARQGLRELTGIKGYGRNEVSRPDGYRSPYQGREYVERTGREALEVMSMAFEDVLSGNPANLTWLLDNDLEMLDLTVGTLFDFGRKVK